MGRAGFHLAYSSFVTLLSGTSKMIISEPIF